MIYELSKNNLKKYHNHFFKHKKYFGILNIPDFIKFNKKIHFLDINTQNLNSIFKYQKIDVYDNYLLGVFNFKNINDMNKIMGRIGVLLNKNILIIINITNNNCITDLINNAINNTKFDYTIDHILSNLISQIVNNSHQQLEYIEKKMINIEKELFKNDLSKNLHPLIFSIKRNIIEYKKYFDFFINFINSCKNFTNTKFLDNQLKTLNKLANYTDTLMQNVINLREIYQSYLDFYQNRVIKVLTIATTIFLPLTLITSWYGMNLKYMPEIECEYSYPVIIVICFIFITTCLIIFKYKKII